MTLKLSYILSEYMCFCVLIAMCPFVENLSHSCCVYRFIFSFTRTVHFFQDLSTTAYSQEALLFNS